MIINRVAVAAGLASLFLCATTPGDGKAKQAEGVTKQNTTAVSWYSGYTMPALLAKPLQPASIVDFSKISRQTWYSEFKVVSEAVPGDTITLPSCSSYLERSHLKLRTVEDPDAVPFMEIALMCRATQLMQTASKPERSYLQTVRFNENLPKYLPKAIAMVISVSERVHIDADKSIKYLDDVNPTTRVELLGPFQARYHHEGGAQELALVAKGDFNGDGIEDMLITSRDSVEGGSYSAIRLFLLTRSSASGAVVILSEYEY